VTDYFEAPRRVIARKPHLCDSCLEWINAGEPYYTQFQVHGGRAGRWKEHVACRAATYLVAAYLPHSDLVEHGMPRVCDMEEEDRDIVLADAPETYAAIWGGAR